MKVSIFIALCSWSLTKTIYFITANSDDGYATGYDYYADDGYEYYGNQEQDSPLKEFVEDNLEEPPQMIPRGYRKPVGGGVAKIAVSILSPRYLEYVGEKYFCLSREEARIKVAELQPNMTLVINSDGTESFVPENAEFERVSTEIDAKRDELLKEFDAMDQEFNITQGEAEIDNDKTLSQEEKATKKLSFREKQEKKMRERAEMERIRDAKIPKVQLGPDCETMVCGACKIVVEEFAKAVVRGIENPNLNYVEDVFNGFCSAKEIRLRYGGLVSDMCIHDFMNVSDTRPPQSSF